MTAAERGTTQEPGQQYVVHETIHFVPGSAEELNRFKQLQYHFADQFEHIFPDILAEKTVVIIPSLSVDQDILSKVDGSVYYEERMLAMLMLLRMPRTNLVYVTSVPIDPVIIDYYLHLLPGITGYHARQRLTLLSCFDSSPKPLSQKILERPRILERIRQSIPNGSVAHIACFNMTALERTLAVQLNLPIYGCNPDLLHLGSKSGSRKIFKECGIEVPIGFEDLRDEQDIADALEQLKMDNSTVQKAVVKMNEGFAGEGNAIFSFDGCPENGSLKSWIKNQLSRRLQIIADNLSYEAFMKNFSRMNGVVEEFISGTTRQSPSVQCRITPNGITNIISTHDQVLDRASGHKFIGANFPANREYAGDIGRMGKEISLKLKEYQVIGRFSADFISVKKENEWKHYALELNLRKGGTTHPFIMLLGLTYGNYDADSGIYLTASGQPRYYFSSDNARSESYRGLTPHDLIDIAIYNRLQYDGSSQQGVMFHLCGALSQYGKLGVVCIGDSHSRANAMYRRTIQVLNKHGRRT